MSCFDSIDLDIESGTSAHYAAFVKRIQSHASTADKKYYVTAAPQCPFPDQNIGDALNEAPFDAVYVQFCECGAAIRALMRIVSVFHVALTGCDPSTRQQLLRPRQAV